MGRFVEAENCNPKVEDEVYYGLVDLRYLIFP